MTINDFYQKNNLKKEATNNIKIQRLFTSTGLDNVGTYLREGPFSSDIGIVHFYWFKGTHCVCYINENFFDSYGCALPQKLCKFIIKRNGYRFYSKYKIQGLTNKRDSYCASNFLFKSYLTKVIEIDFKSAVLKLFCQKFS